MYRSIALLVGGLVSLWAGTLNAQNAVLRQLYGSGVHAYFSRDYLQAHEYLTTAIDAGTKDPRCYYFRGLTYLRLGRADEARMDFRKGAELESKDVNKAFNVARSLERIQGGPRLGLEKHRVIARMAALQESERLRKARYEEIRRQEGRVLQEQAETAPDVPQGAPGAESPAVERPAEPSADDPFGIGPLEEPIAEPGAEQPDQQPGEEPAEPEVVAPAEDDPFGEGAAEPDEPGDVAPAEDDPFGEGAAEPAAQPDQPDDAAEAAEPAAKKKPGGVIGALGTALGKAAAGEQAEDVPAKEDEDKAGRGDVPVDPDADDPFAEPPADDEPVAEPPAADDPVAEPPAADDAPGAEAPAADDPFAEPPADDDPVAEPPAADDPVAEPPAADDPVAKPPAADDPVAEPPAADDPFAEPPAATKKDDDQADPFAEEDAAAPATKKPAAKKPAVDPVNPFAEEDAAAPATKKPAAKKTDDDPADPFVEEDDPAPAAKKPAAKKMDIDPADPFAE